MDPAVAHAHQSALRSISRVVTEIATPTPPQQALNAVAEQLRRGNVMVLTGAGVSTESGVPDYRGPNGSLSRHRPMTYQEFLHDPQASHRYWARAFVGWRVMQNVDGLHEEAGQRNLIALHGDMQHVVCLSCGYEEARADYDARAATANPEFLQRWAVNKADVNPDGDVALSEEAVEEFVMPGCVRCGSQRLKPDVVYFGEPVPTYKKDAAYAMVNAADSVLVAGSSLAVMSGFRFVLEAKKQGKRVATINGGPGRADDRVDTLWRTQVGPAFDAILDELEL